MNREEWGVFIQLKLKEIGTVIAIVATLIAIGNGVFLLISLIPHCVPEPMNGTMGILFLRPIFSFLFIAIGVGVPWLIGYGLYAWVKSNMEKARAIVIQRKIEKGEIK